MNIERFKGTRHNHVPEGERLCTGLLMNPFLKLTVGMITSLNCDTPLSEPPTRDH